MSLQSCNGCNCWCCWGFFFKEKTPIENNMIFFKSIFHALHILKTTQLRNFFPNFFPFFQWHKIKHVFSVHSDKKKCYKASRRWQYPWFHLIKLVIKELKADIVMPIHGKKRRFVFSFPLLLINPLICKIRTTLWKIHRNHNVYKLYNYKNWSLVPNQSWNATQKYRLLQQYINNCESFSYSLETTNRYGAWKILTYLKHRFHFTCNSSKAYRLHSLSILL